MWFQLAFNRGLFASKQYCDHNVTINWPAYMKANAVVGGLSETAKKERLNLKCPRWDDRNPYKFGDGIFDLNDFTRLLRNMVKGITVKFKVKFTSNKQEE